jgi:hypothetical protein
MRFDVGPRGLPLPQVMGMTPGRETQVRRLEV